ncbi:MAG: hypothetical protein N2039_03300 [Gemmataceae bacterium]|nr:hypothetical protein [Gemmataceae bacterium]
MTQLLHPVEPFGEVNVYPSPSGGLRIVATILMEPDIEGAGCGLALDGSASMKKMYGANTPLSPIFQSASGVGNVVEPVARAMAEYLAKFSSSGTVHLLYWACNPDGSGIEEIGVVNQQQARTLKVTGPKQLSWGRKTKLLPPVRHFVDDVFRHHPWAICVFITDGIIEDLPELKQYCLAYARQIAAGKRNFCKLVLIGVGEEVDHAQLTELDDMFEGSGLLMPSGEPIDLWDHKLAREMRQLQEIFAEVVSENSIVAPHGRVLTPDGRVVVDYSRGVPALLRFELPRNSHSFIFELPGHRIVQDLREALVRY